LFSSLDISSGSDSDDEFNWKPTEAAGGASNNGSQVKIEVKLLNYTITVIIVI